MKIRSSTCQQVTKCECGENIHKNNPKHECGKTKCRICKEMVEQPHHCFMQVCFSIFFKPQSYLLFQSVDETKESPPYYIFYDMETSQEMRVDQSDYGEIYEHVPNFIVATKVDFYLDVFHINLQNCRYAWKQTVV